MSQWRWIGVLVTMVAIASGAAASASSSRLPIDRSQPKVTGSAVVGKTLVARPGRWSGARALSVRWERCNASRVRCELIRTVRRGRVATGRKHTLAKADIGHRIRVVVRATNASGTTSATSRVTAVIKQRAPAAGAGSGSKTTPTPTTPTPTTPTSTTPTPTTPTSRTPTPVPPSPTPTPPPTDLFALVPSSGNGVAPAGIPRPDATCAAAVTPTGEKRPSNATANNSVPSDPAAIEWNPAYKTWPHFVADRKQVTGNFTGTTDEIIQWAACKWGLDVNVARAESWLESGWYMSTRSGCAGPEASFGLFQIVAEDCNGNLVHGGWPYVQDDTALNADYWGAWIRGCFDGAFLTFGYPWQNSPAQGYDGESMARITAQDGEYYALWGCVGAWFSNGWYTAPAQGYIATVQSDEAAMPWLQPGT